MVKHPIYCYAHRETHELTPAELERLVQVLLAAERDAGIDPDDGREQDVFDCLRDYWLPMSHELEAYQEHVEQAVLCRRDLVGARPGDEDLCVCGELVRYVELTAAGGRATINRWEHADPLAYGECRDPKPNPERRP